MLTGVAANRYLQNLLQAPVRDVTWVGTHTCLTMGLFALVVYLLRLVARLPQLGGQWGLDDWAITLSMVGLPYLCSSPTYPG